MAQPGGFEGADAKLEIEKMIEKYSAGLHSGVTLQPIQGLPKAPVVVLLTGSIGNLGSQILSLLLKAENVGRVYAMNRPSSTLSMIQRHKERFVDRGLETSLLQSKKLVFVEGDTSRPYLGLQESFYDEVVVDPQTPLIRSGH